MSKSTSYNMQSVSSNAVAQALSNRGNFIVVPRPSGDTRYVKIGIDYAKGDVTPLVFAQAFTSTFILSEENIAKLLNGSFYGITGISWTGYYEDRNKFFWLRIANWWQIDIFSTHTLSILEYTTTAPSGITFTAPYS